MPVQALKQLDRLKEPHEGNQLVLMVAAVSGRDHPGNGAGRAAIPGDARPCRGTNNGRGHEPVYQSQTSGCRGVIDHEEVAHLMV